jgi:hypothetical protein
MVLVVAIIPGCCIWLCTILSRAFSAASKWQLAASFSLALVPLGAAMWAAHLAYHLSTGLLAAVPVFERILGWASPQWAFSAHPLFTGSVTPLQLVLLDAGLLLTLYVSWRLARERVRIGKPALQLFLPWGGLALLLYAAGVWVLLQPMQMRGTMMMN